MRREHRLYVGLLSVGMSLGWVGPTRAQEAGGPAGEQAKSANAQPGAPAGDGDRAREGRGQGRRMDPARMLERLQASFGELNLSDEQKTKVKAIVEKAKPKLDALAKEVEGKEPRERMTKAREAMQPIREELMAVLDETQRQKLRELNQSRQNRGGGERAGGPAMLGRMREAMGKLDLNDEQKKQVDALMAETEKQFADIRAAGGGQGGPEARGKYRELMQSTRKRLNEILTAEQQAELREMMPRRDNPGRPNNGAAGQGEPGAGAQDGAPREPL